MNLFTAGLIILGVAAVAIGAMLLVRRTAPEGSYFQDGDRAAGVGRRRDHDLVDAPPALVPRQPLPLELGRPSSGGDGTDARAARPGGQSGAPPTRPSLRCARKRQLTRARRRESYRSGCSEQALRRASAQRPSVRRRRRVAQAGGRPRPRLDQARTLHPDIGTATRTR